MPRPKLTPEERHARKKANALRWYYKNHDTQKEASKSRWHAHIEAMSPEELEAFRLANNTRNNQWRADNPETYTASKQASDKKYHETNRARLLPAMRERYVARMAAMTTEELEAYYARANATQQRYYRAHAEEIAQRKTIREVKAAMRQLVIATAKGVCTYCTHYNPTCKLCPEGAHKLTVDHITAIVNGGKSTLHNLIACCRSCNAKKRANPNPVMVQPLLL